jgi:hypothetical protein
MDRSRSSGCIRATEKLHRADRSGQKLSTVLQSREAAHEPGIPHADGGVSEQGRPLNSLLSAGKPCSEIVGQDKPLLF